MSDIPAPPAWPPSDPERFALADCVPVQLPWSISLWCLDRGTADGECRLAYGWATPTRSTAAPWTSADVAKVAGAMLRRISFTGPFHLVETILHKVRAGETLATAAQGAGMPFPEQMHCGSLRLVTDDGRDPYAASPWTFLPHSGDSRAAPHLRPRSSPNPDAPARPRHATRSTVFSPSAPVSSARSSASSICRTRATATVTATTTATASASACPLQSLDESSVNSGMATSKA